MKNLRKLFNLVIVCGILMIIATAGASDLGSITFNQCVSQILNAFCVISFGIVGKRILDYACKIKLNKKIKQEAQTQGQLQIVA